jgi:PAS domain-containing protein
MDAGPVFHREVLGGLVERSTSPTARHLFDKWKQIRRERAPAYGDFLPESERHVSERLMVVSRAESGELVYLQIGAAMPRLLGRDITGCTTVGLDSPVLRYLDKLYRRVLDQFTPAHCIFSAAINDVVDLWERLILPVQMTAGSGPRMLILYSDPANFRADMLERALETIDHAILCVRPAINGDGAIVDGWLAFANRAAQTLFGIGPERRDLQVRSLPFLFSDPAIWTRLTDPVPTEPRTIWHKHPVTQADYMISSRLAGDHLIFSITPVSGSTGDLLWV